MMMQKHFFSFTLSFLLSLSLSLSILFRRPKESAQDEVRERVVAVAVVVVAVVVVMRFFHLFRRQSASVDTAPRLQQQPHVGIEKKLKQKLFFFS
jgi:hypothetical protein